MQAAGHLLAAGAGNQPVDVKEEIFRPPVVRGTADVGLGHGVEREAERMRVVRPDDPLRGEHRQMCVVDRHQRREEQLLGVVEVLVQDVLDVFGAKRITKGDGLSADSRRSCGAHL